MDSEEIDWSKFSWGQLPSVEDDKSLTEVETTGSDSRGLGGVLDHIKVDTIGVTILPASLCPPHLTGGGDGSGRISWLLLDLTAYIADQRNATTAKSSTRGRHEIQATLCWAPPPVVSHLSVYCPALPPGDFGTEPCILATSDELILFKASICNGSVAFEQAMQDYLVYRVALPTEDEAGTGPSLTPLPHPGRSCPFANWQVGILQRCSHGQSNYVVAVLRNSDDDRPGEGAPSLYDLHRF
ncbi:hypothetical protein QOZ80_9BG0697160 [Eleusine coracana subsp. coracana]|nr:hypothetical protein QOZ80_9BG0697160 [Eleusine coracana subsp. coracana]